MIGVISDDSKVKMLEGQLANFPFNTVSMGLFTNIITPTHLTHLSDLTELAVTGYARQPVTSWGTPTLSPDNHAVSSAPAVIFHNTGVADSPLIRGWFYVDTSSNTLLAAATFEAPFTLVATTGVITITPFFRLTGE